MAWRSHASPGSCERAAAQATEAGTILHIRSANNPAERLYRIRIFPRRNESALRCNLPTQAKPVAGIDTLTVDIAHDGTWYDITRCMGNSLPLFHRGAVHRGTWWRSVALERVVRSNRRAQCRAGN